MKNKSVPIWLIHVLGVANAYYAIANFSREWYVMAAMSAAGFIVSVDTLRRRRKSQTSNSKKP